DRGIVPDVVVGTSVGAMNAAVYAADATHPGIDHLENLWCQARTTQIFPIAPRSIVENLRERRGYLFPNHGISDWIETHLSHDRLEDFPIPLHVVATEVDSGRPVLLSRGDALTALLASSAIPGVFPPVSIDGMLLHDGGVAADIPLPQALELSPTTVYVLSTMGGGETPRPTAWMLLDRVFGRPSEEQEMPPHPDVIVHWLPAPTFSGNPYSFRESRRLIEEAHALTHAHLDRLEDLPTASIS
ncbi:MAG: patatin-like phospholipase family protein, partial [Acidimicrobiales bacterium]